MATLRSYGILDTPPEPRFDDIARLAAVICGAPVAVVSFADAERHWYKARVGLGIEEVAWSHSSCSYVVENDLDELVVRDLAADPRFGHHGGALGAPVCRFYAGVAMRAPSGVMIGTVCIADVAARVGGLTPAQLGALHALARHAMALVWARTMIVDPAAAL
ncbi:GAF domain-containing protein [Methylopila capsulata]|uniref:GAF domain-containing protein n=1 Tax=Methylopila capsulata TaxID=61654 RepID=A0ABS2T4Y6_9HYPH|nr:GAF domain-containing protein [Methylopila capsulata]MBM7850886.1 GAF domain-containing protein [Methylopila capsulata]